MMFEKIVTVGDKVDIVKKGKVANDAQLQYYVSQILELKNDNTAILSIPMMNRHIVPLPIGGKFDLCFYTKSGLYHCMCTILERYKLGNIYVMSVKFLSELEKIQRRQYYRLDCILDMEYRKLNKEETSIHALLWNKQYDSTEEKDQLYEKLGAIDKNYTKGVAINISGGGIKFNSAEHFEKEDLLEILFILEGPAQTAELALVGKVIGIETIYNKRNTYETRVEFIEIDRDTKESIVRYVFNEERKQRKRSVKRN